MPGQVQTEPATPLQLPDRDRIPEPQHNDTGAGFKAVVR